MTLLLISISRRRASVLILVLWMLIILGLVGMTFSSTVRNELQVAQAATGRTEAYWAARAGIEKSIALLELTDLSTLVADDLLFDDPETFANQPVGLARFSIIAPGLYDDEPRFGLIDESSLMDINHADEEALMLLPAMVEEMAGSLIDWRDDDALPEIFGAEEDYYMVLEEPYSPRNGPLVSIRELMRVRGWDIIFNSAYPDPYVRFLNVDERPETIDREDARALLSLITVWSRSNVLAPDGQAKMKLGDVDADAIRQRIPDMTEIQARSIAEYGSNNSYESVTDLLDVTEVQSEGRDAQGNIETGRSGRRSRSGRGDRDGRRRPGRRDGSDRRDRGRDRDGGDRDRGDRDRNGRGGRSSRPGGSIGYMQPVSAMGGIFGFQSFSTSSSSAPRSSSQGSSSGSGSAPNAATGPKVFDLASVGPFIDYFTTEDSEEETRSGLMNINTASHDALMTIPGMTDSFASSIIQERESAGAFDQPGLLATLHGVDEESFRSIYPKITTNSTRFRVISRGEEPSSGAVVTLEAVLEFDGNEVFIKYWREF